MTNSTDKVQGGGKRYAESGEDRLLGGKLAVSGASGVGVYLVAERPVLGRTCVVDQARSQRR